MINSEQPTNKEDEESIPIGQEKKDFDPNATNEYPTKEIKKQLEDFDNRLKGVKDFNELYKELKDYRYLVESIDGNMHNTAIRSKLSQFIKNKKDYGNLGKMVENLLENYDDLFINLDLYDANLNKTLKSKIVELLKSEFVE